MMKYFLALAFLIIAGSAQAQLQTELSVSSCVYSGATVSSGTWKRQIDALEKGNVNQLAGRTSLKITLPRGSFDITVGYDTSVSTDLTVAAYGRVLSSSGAANGGPVTYEIPLSNRLSLFAVASDQAGIGGQKISVEQCRPLKKLPSEY